MPATIEVAAFVFGMLLVLVAMLGQSVKIKDVEVANLGPWQRGLAGVLGIGLVLLGLNQGRVTLPVFGAAPIAERTGVGSRSATTTTLPCFTDIAVGDLVTLPVELDRKVHRNFSSGQPRNGLLAVQFQNGDTLIGGIKVRSNASGSGFDIVAVVDAACNPVTGYTNLSRPSQTINAPYNYDSIKYTMEGQSFSSILAYGEGDQKIWVSSLGLAQ